MFSERDADVSVEGEADGMTIKRDTASGASATASVSPAAGHTLIPVRLEGFGTAPTYSMSHDGGPTTGTPPEAMSGALEAIADTVGDGSTNMVVSEVSASNDSDAASGDTAKVVAIELSVAASEV